MQQIKVDPQQVEATALRIDEQNQEYQRAYATLFSAVEMMKSAWQGKDNTAFSNRIGKFEGDFKELSILCTQYAEFLRSSARAYREMQNDLASQANNLVQ